MLRVCWRGGKVYLDFSTSRYIEILMSVSLTWRIWFFLGDEYLAADGMLGLVGLIVLFLGYVGLTPYVGWLTSLPLPLIIGE